MAKNWYQVDCLSDGSYEMVQATSRTDAACIATGNIIDNESGDMDLHTTTRKDGNSLIISWPYFGREEYRVTRVHQQ